MPLPGDSPFTNQSNASRPNRDLYNETNYPTNDSHISETATATVRLILTQAHGHKRKAAPPCKRSVKSRDTDGIFKSSYSLNSAGCPGYCRYLVTRVGEVRRNDDGKNVAKEGRLHESSGGKSCGRERGGQESRTHMYLGLHQ